MKNVRIYIHRKYIEKIHVKFNTFHGPNLV